ncbi:hypothetical protein FPZ12_011565 [Amycolatopsis acidicola]|uniref:Uncharacterized protein n=1 Tax=Amycolatopsis acidicola TaxID=2596893 RepID=A0A5N0V779_9PSEU|nr:hypothetical protein [Amycolatopsis acidicola]KAA9162276.1 hypothetical protein FPZ12_011565 [Amycolatopsis acidicola]
MTTATHSLDTSSGTTVAELLARNGARPSRTPHRRSRAEGQFDGTLAEVPIPAQSGTLSGLVAEPFTSVRPDAPAREDDTVLIQYRYDESAFAGLLAPAAETTAVDALPIVEPAVAEPVKEKSRTGRKIAGLAFAGAVLVGGWALASAQTPDHQGPANAGPVPGQGAARDSLADLSAPVGGQVALLGSSTPTGTAEIPAPATTAQRQPDQGQISGKLPTTTQKKAAAAPTTKKAPQAPVAARVPAQIPAPANWPTAGRPGQKNQGNQHDGGGKSHKPHH